MTFEMGMENLRGSTKFPYTATFPPRSKTEAFQVSPISPGTHWQYTYTNYYKLGSSSAQHDDNYIYQLPYAPGNKFKVTQGYNGKFSHTGSNKYAIDWDLPEGTLVHAARGGVFGTAGLGPPAAPGKRPGRNPPGASRGHEARRPRHPPGAGRGPGGGLGSCCL